MTDLEFSKETRLAIQNQDIDRVSELLRSRTDLTNMVTPFGTWLHVASRVGNLDIVKKLVELGVNINLSGGTFETGPLKTAISSGHIKVVKYFLSQGADIDLREPFQNPIFSAIYNGRLDIVKLLVEYGVDTSVKYTGENMKNMDALAYARELGQLEIAEFLSTDKQ